MKRKNNIVKALMSLVAIAGVMVIFWKADAELLTLAARITLKSAESFLPLPVVEIQRESGKTTNVEASTETEISATSERKSEASENTDSDFSATPDDIVKLIKKEKKLSVKHKKDGPIVEQKFTDEGVTDKLGAVKVKNTNRTQINLEKMLSQKADLKAKKDDPTVLIFHTHTTETYQILDRGFYEQGFMTRSNDLSRNMVRVGDAICEELESAGFSVVHDTHIYDSTYSGSYYRSYDAEVEYMKKYPNLQVLLDIHRDAIQTNDGTKIKPTAEINGKKAAQVMIISGCQEEGNGIEDFEDWKYNLIFGLQLQKEMEETFPGLTRPLYFCARDYNMNLTHCSLLLEVGSDSNTLEEAVYSGKCIGKSLSQLLEKYTEETEK